jgi:chromosome segregation ATPase
MSRIETAATSLASALDRLEKIAAPLGEAASRSSTLTTCVGQLTEEREQLLIRLARIEDDSRVLSAANEEIEGRLDGAIGEIRAALGR